MGKIRWMGKEIQKEMESWTKSGKTINNKEEARVFRNYILSKRKG